MMRRFSSLHWSGYLQVCRMAVLCFAMLATIQLLAHAQEKERPIKYPTLYRTIQIDGFAIFYREAGAKDAPTLLLLHGLPSSSRMFEPLFARISDHSHLVAPDYPGFGHWGKYDLSFDLSEPEAYRHDVPNAQVHVLDAGHFALDTAAVEIAALVRGFVASFRATSAGAAGDTPAADH
jgi:hypothetical protein